MTHITTRSIIVGKVCIGLCAFGLMFSSLGYAEIVGYWHFDEGKGDVAKDSSGKNNHGKLVGPNWVDGKLGKALEFDGKDDYVDAGIDASLDVKNITMAMWVWFDHIPYVHDIALNKEGSYRLIGGEVDNTHVSVRYATTNTAWGPGTVAGKTALVAKKWYHAAATYDGKAWKIYLDGKLDGEKPESGNLVSNPNNHVYIGLYNSPNGWPFTGMIDEVVIANTALSEKDINSLMLGPTAVQPEGKLAQTWGNIKDSLSLRRIR